MPRSLLLFAVLLVSCGRRSASVEEMNTVEVTLPNGKKITCQTMRKDIDLVRGMMFQDSLPKDHGMLLFHPREERYPVFTYNVRLPLDFVWIDQRLRIVQIVANVPPCKETSARACPTYGGKEKARYILELNAGEAAANGLGNGQLVEF